jgi:hypothetical protein
MIKVPGAALSHRVALRQAAVAQKKERLDLQELPNHLPRANGPVQFGGLVDFPSGFP